MWDLTYIRHMVIQYYNPYIEIQELIHKCTQDEETGRPLTKLDRELDDILKIDDDLDYVDITLITKEETRPNEAIASTIFVPELDDNTVSTFGTVKDTTTKAIELSKTQRIDDDERSILSRITLESCMSKIRR